MSSPETKEPVWATIQAKLRDFVREEQIPPGRRLPPERELAQRLGVSRTSLRQALTALRVEGLIDVRHGDGIYLLRTADDIVPPITAELTAANPELPALGEVRNALEAQGARWAAHRRTDDDLATLVDSLRTMEHEVLAGEAGLTGDRRFHAAVLAAAHNEVLTRMLDAIANGAGKIAHASLSRPGQPERSLAAHRLIFDAIVSREPEEAQRLMFEHLEVTGDMSAAPGRP